MLAPYACRAVGNQSLETREASYIAARKPLADEALKSWLSQGNLTSAVYGGDFASVNSSSLPTISIALSGGGNRAALFGAGVMSAMDGRNASSVAKGTGGLLQATTYLSGLSGGSWLLSSYISQNMPEICERSLAPNRAFGADLFLKQTPWSLVTAPTVPLSDGSSRMTSSPLETPTSLLPT